MKWLSSRSWWLIMVPVAVMSYLAATGPWSAADCALAFPPILSIWFGAKFLQGREVRLRNGNGDKSV
jgi:hypothetical protein